MEQDKSPETALTQAEKLRQQLNDLPIDAYLEQHKPKEVQKNSNMQATKGYAASMHLVSGVLVGGVLGYGIDYLAETIPLFIGLLIPLGMIAGFKNMISALNSNNDTDTDKDKS